MKTIVELLRNLRLDCANLTQRKRASFKPCILNASRTASLAFFMSCCLTPWLAFGEDLRKAATWDWPDASRYEAQFLSYLDQAQLDGRKRDQVIDLWNSQVELARGPGLLQRLLDTAGLIEPRINDLAESLRDPSQKAILPQELEWLSSDVPGWMQDTIRLACGRALAQQQMYDEALETLSGLELIQVCDPATLIFYRAACEHHLMKAEECVQNLDLLLEREEELPLRYRQLAQLMKADIKNLEADSLDEVTRLMRDVERRLDLGRAGKRVRDEEQEIVDKLDKMIEKIEQQMQQQQQNPESGGQGGQQPANPQPMDESRAASGRGPGDVDNKELEERGEWGNLPPAQRQESLQRLTEELPSHYREVIEGYFRQLAKDRD